jgi:DNA-binding MarR family transcriptional regulator
VTQSDPIPEPIARFLDCNVESIEQLEMLRVLGEAPGKEWTAGDLAKEVQCRSADIGGHLAALQQRGLLKTEQRQSLTICRHAPATPEIEGQLDELLRFYKERPVTLIKAVYERAQARLKAFADAFRLRKEK